MSRDEFDLWLAHPVTRWVFAGIRNAQTQERAEWDRVSWEGGSANQRFLDELRNKHAALGEVTENTYEIWSEWNGEEPERD